MRSSRRSRHSAASRTVWGLPGEAGRDLVGQKLVRTGGRFSVDPHQFYGLEINPRAVPIADLVLWIGYLKWQLRTGGPDAITEPVLDAYGTIRHQDAILDYDARAVQRDEAGEPMSRWDGLTKEVHPVTGKEVPDPNARTPLYVYENPRSGEWPEVEYIVGNPPFVGGKDMRAELGDGYSEACWKARPHVPGGADFVMHFWDEAARRLARMETDNWTNPLRRFGLITDEFGDADILTAGGPKGAQCKGADQHSFCCAGSSLAQGERQGGRCASR